MFMVTKWSSLSFDNLKTNFNTYNKILKSTIRFAKRSYYHTMFAKFKNDIQATWTPINEIVSRIKGKNQFLIFFKMVIT